MSGLVQSSSHKSNKQTASNTSHMRVVRNRGSGSSFGPCSSSDVLLKSWVWAQNLALLLLSAQDTEGGYPSTSGSKLGRTGEKWLQTDRDGSGPLCGGLQLGSTWFVVDWTCMAPPWNPLLSEKSHSHFSWVLGCSRDFLISTICFRSVPLNLDMLSR